MAVLPARPFLQEKLALPIENEEVNRAVAQVIPMHFTPGRVAEQMVVFVDYGEALRGNGVSGSR
jgi:hypothetical protein